MLKIGLIGAGMIGGVHAQAYAGLRGAKLVGIVDSRPDAAEKLSKTHGVSSYSTLEALDEAEKPDVVSICVPTDLHRDLAVRAAGLGMHVFCEKPIARTKEDAEQMVEACRMAGVKLMIGQVLRFEPDYVKAKSMIDEQRVGRVGTVRMLRTSGMPAGSGDWYQNPGKSGGVILDLAIHDLDWLRWTFGEAERVYAKSLQGRKGAHADLAFISVRMKNGVIAHVTGSWAHQAGFRTFLEVAGREGVMKMEYDEVSMPIRNTVRTENGIVHRNESPLGVSPYRAEVQHFIDCIAEGREPAVTGEDALKTLELSLAALESLASGKAVTL